MPERSFELTHRARLIVIGIMTVAILAVINSQIVQKEAIIRDGTTILLGLAPVDPRSLIQGDYMALRYAMTDGVARLAETAGLDDGRIIVRLDQDGVAELVAIDEGQQLGANQHLLRFRKRGDSVRLASDAYFFEERQLAVYDRARFGELRVADDGEAVLTGLRDQQRERLGPTAND